MNNLKICRRCGSGKGQNIIKEGKFLPKYYIKCNDCDYELKERFLFKRRAIKAWNDRRG